MAKAAESQKSLSGNTVALGYEFQFVEVRDPSERWHQGYLGTTRAHVMRHSHDRRKKIVEEGGVRDVASATAATEGAGQSLHRFKNGPLGLAEFRKKPKRKLKVLHRETPTGEVPELGNPKAYEIDTATDITRGLHGSFERNSSSEFALSKANNISASITHLSPPILQSYNNTTTLLNGHQVSTFEMTTENHQYSAHEERENELSVHNLHQLLGAGNIDPFSCLPFSHSSNSRVQYLLHVGKCFYLPSASL